MSTSPASRADRDAQVIAERLSGLTLRDVADRHHLSHEGVRTIVVREGRRRIDQLEADLAVAREMEELGKEAAFPTFLVPFQDAEDWKAALSFFQWTLDQLRARDVPVEVTTRQTSAGVVFQLRQEQP